MTSPLPIHQIAMKLREDMDDLLPEGVGVVINASENPDSSGSIRLTVSSWPQDITMINPERVIADRQAFLQGSFINLTHLPVLSIEASHLAEILQKLLDKHFPPVTEAGTTTWSVATEVLFDQRALERERIAIIHVAREKWLARTSHLARTVQ